MTARRLSNYEYDNTVRDLLGVWFRPSLEYGFPSDETAGGFDNQGDALSISPLLLEKYLDAAERIADHVLTKPDARKRLVIEEPSEERSPQEVLQQSFKKFLPRAFRRPVEPIELAHITGLGERVLEGGGTLDEALSIALQATLVSPHFLFRVERSTGAPEQQRTEMVEPIEAYALATRLSYFLWASTPDQKLLDLAKSGALLDEATLRQQTRRMLQHKRSRALVESFMHQWLALGLLNEIEPDRQKYPMWSSYLREAMVAETERLFDVVLREDLPIRELLSPDRFEVNPRLAELYGVDFEGRDPKEMYEGGGTEEERKWRGGPARHQTYPDETKWVATPAPPDRFGLLTHASMLALTSNPTDTSPVKRGKWILEALLGDPPPPAPPNVPSLQETATDASDLPLREQLEIHRKNPNCAGCHKKMDPLGLALQNYDPIGRWRDSEQDSEIDASGEIDGQAFNGPAQLAELLAAREEDIARNFTQKLLAYALGRGVEIDDQCAIDAVLESARGDGFRVQSLIEGVVLSDPFRKRDVLPHEVGNPQEAP